MADEPKPWSEIAAHFDPNMPAETYDMARRKYFDDVVRPRLGKQDNPLAAWSQFQTQTDRPKLSTGASIGLTAGLAAAGAAKGLATAPLRLTGHEHAAASLDKFNESLKTLARREGKSTLPSGLGELAGSLAPFAVGGELVEASELPYLAQSLIGQRIVRGAMTVGAFEAASAKEGERLTLGVKGAVAGAAFEGVLGLGGRLLQRGTPSTEVNKVIQKALHMDADPEEDELVAKEIDKSAKVSREEGRPKTVQENANVKGVNVLMRDAKDQPSIVKVREGAEDKAIQEVKNYLKTGGSVEGIHFNPDAWSATQGFMAKLAKESDEKFANAKVIRTTEQQAPRVAAEMSFTSKVDAQAVDHDQMVVQSSVPSKPSHMEMQSRMYDLLDSENYPLSKGARGKVQADVEKLWDETVPRAAKEKIAQSLANWDLKDMIPPEWVREPDLSKVEGSAEQEFDEAEINRLSEITQRSKELGVTNPGVMEEAIRKGELASPIANLKVPDSERISMRMTEEGPVEEKVSSVMGETERRFGLQTSPEQIEEWHPGAAAVTYGPGDFFDVEGKLTQKPTIAYSGSPSREFVYHEGLHVDKFHTPDAKEIIRAEHPSTERAKNVMDQIGSGMREHTAYKSLTDGQMREEAYVHAATAIRLNDTEALANIVRLDTNVDRVKNMVNHVSEGLLDAARSNIDTAPSRVLQRKMQDLLLRTGDDRMWELRNSVKNFLSDAWYDPEAGEWKTLDTRGAVASHSSFEDLANYLHDSNGTGFAPSATLSAEMHGVRGPITPRGGSPVAKPAQMDVPPDTRWQGWTAISGLFRPMQPWVADLDSRVNEALSVKGMKLPIFDKFKNLSEADREYEGLANELYDSAAKVLEGTGKKQYDYFNVLTTDPKYWKEMGTKLNLSEADMEKVNQLNGFLQDYRDKTGINPFNYLRDELPRLRGHNYNPEFVYGNQNKTVSQMSTFEKLITQGKLDPKNQHIGSFIDTMIREARLQKLAKPMTELRQIVDKKAKDGSYVLGNMRYPLDNYLKYMSGIPDVTSQVMKKTVSDFQGFLGEKAAQLNKYLPKNAQLPTEFSYPGAIINKMMVWSYAAGLGLRASIPVRDALQVFMTTMPVLGPQRFLEGLTFFAKNGFKLAEDSGALLGRKNMGDLYGDIFKELPPGASTDRITALAQKLLSPSRAGHNIGRAIGFYGEYHSALEGVRDYQSGKITVDELVKDRTHLWFNDKPVTERILDMIHTGASPEDAAKSIALEMTDLTLWPYRRGMQPTLLRTGAGRIFGQFGMWPMNYLDFIRRGATKFGEYPEQAAKTTAIWTATNYAAVQAMQGIGADADKWFFVSPAGYGLSPHAQFVLDLAKAWEETPDGREARKRVLEYPLDFFPAGTEARNIEKVLSSGAEPFDDNGKPTPALIQVLGFKPLKDTPDRDFEDRIKFELGLTGAPRRTQ